MIGDDEHGWIGNTVFNFEGGCYAKCIDLTAEKEPDIFAAVKEGALLENICFFDGTNEVNYKDTSLTENTRVSYPINHIKNIAKPSVGENPKNIFFLTRMLWSTTSSFKVKFRTSHVSFYFWIHGKSRRY